MFLTLIKFILIITPIITLLFIAGFIAGFVALVIYLKLAFELVKGLCKSNARLDHKIVLVTGGNTGIGLETARDLASRGARVIIACRDGKKCAEAISDITKTTGNKKIEYKYLNLAKFSSIRQFAEDFNKSYDRLDILVNNAGCAGLPHEASEDRIDLVMQVNYLGPFLLTNLLMDKIQASSAGRIVIVSSVMHFFGFFGRLTPDRLNGLHTKCPLFKYGNSKLCDILWTKALAKRLPNNVTVNALHPGLVKTDIFNKLPRLLVFLVMFLIDLLNFKTPVEGAQTSIYLAVSEDVANVSGKYFMECVEAQYARVADNDKIVEEIWDRSLMLTN